MATKNENQFGERMSVEDFLSKTGSKNLDVYPRADKPGYYYFATEKTLGYVPQELGKKIENGETISEKTIIMDEKGFDATTITQEDVDNYGI